MYWTTDTFTYTLIDGQGGSSTATVSVIGAAPKQILNSPGNAPQLLNILLENLSIAPNPSEGLSTLAFRLNRDAHIGMQIHDVTGRVMSTLLEDPMSAGEYVVNWNGTRSNGQLLASGTYFVVIEVREGSINRTQTIPL